MPDLGRADFKGSLDAELLGQSLAGLADRVPEVVLRERSLPTQNIGKQQRRHNGRVALDDELRSGFAQLAPGDLFVRHRTGVGSVACRRIRDLAEIRP